MTQSGGVVDGDTMKRLHKKAKGSKPSIIENGGVPPRRVPNSDRRPREYLTPKEVDRLIETAKKRGRYGLRDATMILVTFRHGLRALEVCNLTWDQIDFAHGLLHVRRVKNGMPSVHPMGGGEVRSLRALKRDESGGRYVFVTERKGPMTPATFRWRFARIA